MFLFNICVYRISRYNSGVAAQNKVNQAFKQADLFDFIPLNQVIYYNGIVQIIQISLLRCAGFKFKALGKAAPNQIIGD